MTEAPGPRRAIAAALALGATVLAAIVALVLAARGGLDASQPGAFHGRDVSAEHWDADFTLSDASGRLRSLRDFRGQVVLLGFGYTHCPDVCPTTLARFAEVRRLLGADAQRVQALFVTVDPERDSAELLRRYVPSFDPTFLGLRGTPAQTQAAVQSFHASYRIVRSGDSVEVDHSASTYLIDAQGRVRIVTPFDQSAQALAQDVRRLLRAM